MIHRLLGAQKVPKLTCLKKSRVVVVKAVKFGHYFPGKFVASDYELSRIIKVAHIVAIRERAICGSRNFVYR